MARMPESASRCSMAAQLVILLALIANTHDVCVGAFPQPSRSCHAVLSCRSCSRWENAITLALSLCPRAGGFSYRSVHNRRHIFNVLWCVPAYAPLSLPRACACITAVDVARRYSLRALAARQRRQLMPWLPLTVWPLLLLAQLWLRSQPAWSPSPPPIPPPPPPPPCLYTGIVNLSTLTSYGSPSPSLCR